MHGDIRARIATSALEAKVGQLGTAPAQVNG
jgi:hypothetical protein